MVSKEEWVVVSKEDTTTTRERECHFQDISCLLLKLVMHLMVLVKLAVNAVLISRYKAGNWTSSFCSVHVAC